jgi:hypothetical protein
MQLLIVQFSPTCHFIPLNDISKAKVKMASHYGALGDGGNAPRILKLRTIWRLVVSFTLWLLEISLEKEPPR